MSVSKLSLKSPNPTRSVSQRTTNHERIRLTMGMDGETPSWLEEGGSAAALPPPVPPPHLNPGESDAAAPAPANAAAPAPRNAPPTDNVAGSILASMNAKKKPDATAAGTTNTEDNENLSKLIVFMRVLNMAASVLLITVSVSRPQCHVYPSYPRTNNIIMLCDNITSCPLNYYVPTPLIPPSAAHTLSPPTLPPPSAAAKILQMVSLPHISVWVLAIYSTCGGILVCCLETQLKFIRTVIAMNFGFLFHSVYRMLFYCLMASVCWTFGGALGVATAIVIGCVAVFNTYVLCRYPSYRKMREDVAAEEDRRIQAKINQQVRKQAISNMGWGRN